eukprot:scaffold94965_cov32-Attheya_sp.AAC.1
MSTNPIDSNVCGFTAIPNSVKDEIPSSFPNMDILNVRCHKDMIPSFVPPLFATARGKKSFKEVNTILLKKNW